MTVVARYLSDLWKKDQEISRKEKKYLLECNDQCGITS